MLFFIERVYFDSASVRRRRRVRLEILGQDIHSLSLIYSPLKQFNGSHTAPSKKFIKITWKKVKKFKLAGNKI